MKRRLSLPVMCERADSRFGSVFLRGALDSPPHFAQVFRDQVEVCQRRSRDWLLMLARNFE